MSTTRVILSVFLLCIGASLAVAALTITLLPGTAILLSKKSGGTTSVSSATNIFSPAVFADYKHFGGEPTGVVDRFRLTSGTVRGKTCTVTSPCFPDFAYVSSPQGFVEPHYSTFFKSSDLGQSFRTTAHFPATDLEQFNAGGGGDSHIAIGQISHKVFFTDLPANCVTLNVSTDFGETFTAGPDACGTTPGAVDDRNWVAVDELVPGDMPPTTGHVYVTFTNFSSQVAPTLEAQISTDDGNTATADFSANSTCNAGTLAQGSVPVTGGTQAPDSTHTDCPDPADTFFDVAGPPVVDINNTHNIYIPFIRSTPIVPGVSSGPPYSLYIAVSTDKGVSWTRVKVADRGMHNPANIFPVMTVDKAGNLYYTWSQTQGPQLDTINNSGFVGEQDVHYTFATNATTYSTTGTITFATPINLTQETGDSAVFPWITAGDAGQVDLVFYKANTGLNSDVAEVDANGNPCTPPTVGPDTCAGPNPSVWNVYFSQSQNALNTGPNFKTVQISAQPNHVGQVCTFGLSCTTGGNRNLLDFFTVDIDHLGAANVVWADDNNSRNNAINRFSRQISGNSVFKNTTIGLINSWPITDHAVTDQAGDVFSGIGTAKGSCAGMDVLATSEKQSGGILTVTLTLNNAPTATEAAACSPESGTTGGIWGAQFWAPTSNGGSENFYIAYRDNPPDNGGVPHAEAGRLDHVNATVTSLEFDPKQAATFGGTCFNAGGAPTNRTPCTLILTTTLNTPALGVKSGAGLFSITGLSIYQTGSVNNVPFTTVNTSNTEQADAATGFEDAGTGTTSP